MKKIKKTFTVLLLICFTMGITTACKTNEPTPAPGDANSASAAPTDNANETKDETFIYAQGAEPRGLDPALVDDGESAAVIVNVYEGLIKYNDTSTALEPCLAKTWEVSPDGLVYRFDLRDDVYFHDGTKFNAEAVKICIDRQLPPNDTSNMPYSDFTFGYVSSVDVISDYVVQITLKQPSTPFLANLAMSQAAPIISPAALEATNGNVNEAPVGTGPFKFVKWEKEVAVTLTRNEDYWGEKPALKTLIFQIIPDNSARASAMMAGTIDGMSGLDAGNVAAVESKGAKIFQADGMNINYMAFNTTRAPFNDPKLREAVVRAINVDELVQSLYLGYSTPAYSVLPTFVPGYNPDVKPYEYDVEQSKKILEDLGMSGLTIKMITYSNPRPYNSATGTKLAEAIQGYLAQAGIQAEITQYDWTTYKSKVQQGEGDICFYGWNGDNGDPDNFMNLLATEDMSMNVAGYNNPEYKALIEQAAATPNGEERNALYGSMGEIVAKDAAWLPISHSQLMAAYAENVEGFTVHPTSNVFFKSVSKK